MGRLPDNLWERVAQQVGQWAADEVEPLAERMRGGRLPPGAVPESRARQLEEYLLVSAPRASLPPEMAMEADRLWAEIYGQQDEVSLKKWSIEMEADRLKTITPPGGMTNANP